MFFRCSVYAGLSGVARANEAFSPAFDDAYTTYVQNKLGLAGMDLGEGWMHESRSEGCKRGAGSNNGSSDSKGITSDAVFVMELFGLMADAETDFTDTWRALMEVPALSAASNETMSFLSARAPKGPIPPETVSRSSPPHEVEKASVGTELSDGTGYSRIIRDEECLRPLRKVLEVAKVSSEQAGRWGRWIGEYMARIDSQVSQRARM